VGVIAWETTDGFSDPRETIVLSVLQNILRSRALGEIRERLGVAYSPVVASSASQTVEGFGYLALMAEVAPAKMNVLTDAVGEIASELRSRPVSEDELARAVQPLLNSLATDRAGNTYWRTALAGGTWDERRLERIREEEARLRGVTPADLQRAAQQYLGMDAVHRITIMPNGPG
jgi:zinc protease